MCGGSGSRAVTGLDFLGGTLVAGVTVPDSFVTVPRRKGLLNPEFRALRVNVDRSQVFREVSYFGKKDRWETDPNNAEQQRQESTKIIRDPCSQR